MTARSDAVATARRRLAAQVVARLLAGMRGDGQQALDLWAPDMTDDEKGPIT